MSRRADKPGASPSRKDKPSEPPSRGPDKKRAELDDRQPASASRELDDKRTESTRRELDDQRSESTRRELDDKQSESTRRELDDKQSEAARRELDERPAASLRPDRDVSDLVLGLDEAGRGPILGPMVMAAVALRPAKAAALTRAGVMDSKRFGAGEDAHAARSDLVPRILEAASWLAISVVDVAEVDRYTRRGLLNRLEQERAAGFIRASPPVKRVVCDGARLFSPLRALHPRLDALDHGEEQHVAVAAASVLAKVRRDELFGRIAARYRPAFGALRGGGYMNDATRAFLRAYIERHRALPPEGRRSWPWTFARDLLGEDFDPLAGVPDDGPGQLALALG